MSYRIIARIAGLVGGLAMLAANALAGEVDVVGVKVRKGAPGVYSFDVTLKHADTGWKHYADKWDVVGPDGKVLGTRVLFHPHEHEQPFTRSLGGVKIPADVKTVMIRGHDLVHGYGGIEMKVTLPQ